MRLESKTIAITGSGSGLGRDAALLFAAEGASVVVSDIVAGRAAAVAKQITANGGTASHFDADARDEDAVAALVEHTVATHGRIDGIWANAGIPEPGFGQQQFIDSRVEDWNDIFAVNVTGAYLAFKHAARWMVANEQPGVLLATTSAAAFAAYPGFPMYAASKAAANGLVRAAAVELGKYGIRANAICPTHGMSVNFALPSDTEVLGKSYEEMQPWDPESRAMPLRLNRPPTLRDNANLALFLLSEDSAYISGQTILSSDGATFARPAIIFPSDLDKDADISSGAIPEDLAGRS